MCHAIYNTTGEELDLPLPPCPRPPKALTLVMVVSVPAAGKSDPRGPRGRTVTRSWSRRQILM